MPSLFIANTSKKSNEFTFRLPGISQLRRYIIPAGKQLEVLRGAQGEEIDSVIEQHKVYGLVREDEVQRICKFAGLVYAIDKPVKVDRMELMLEKNDEFLAKESNEERIKAAVAIDNQLTQSLQENSLKPHKKMEIEVQEVGIDERDTKKKPMQQRIKVSKNDQ